MPKDRPASLAISKSEVVFSGKIWDIKSESFDYNGTTLIREFVAHPGASLAHEGVHRALRRGCERAYGG